MATKITIQSDETFDVAFLLGVRAYYICGENEEYYPGLSFRAVELPNTVAFPRELRIKDEPALPSQAEAMSRAHVIIKTTICQAVVNMILSDYAQEP